MKKQAESRQSTKLRSGYTTGACATAATKAALLSLITGRAAREVEILLPIGKKAKFSIDQARVSEESAKCSVIKDGGDDPDATHGARIVSTVSWSDEPGIRLDGGAGVGKVTKLGLPVPVGEAAINPVPRKMIREAVTDVLSSFAIHRGVKVVISVPGGEKIAKKTLNERLGIVGGISILGTRGTVIPFSTAAYRASVAQAVQVAGANGNRHLVFTTGGRSEKAAQKIYPELPEEAFVQAGNFIGFALKHAKQAGVLKVTLAGMMGKLSKVARGEMNAHSGNSTVDCNFLAQVAEKAGASPTLAAGIRKANNATHAGQLIEQEGNSLFFTLLCERICRACLVYVEGGIKLETVLVKLSGERLGRAEISG
ncbi:cobalt-precorrin-5B (C(1))-methyltransferase [Thermoactinomyces mirandus]|uniref:Cobalt-precorrin-5B C(1)-methyltransferase n=1 Tax=Thermoactinomyces mirandus TaxID=2756294 RepID=A0A7W1XUT7_9BACL|nr:cobalt-precorrin-5B (C(1))-methyltransferase [Thermoactinomyces mirandus]MBA4603693.1 cobalt-precorrin-5B (C(1))-methyltransferase [Thermoactinomyces mirandus]